MVAFLYESHRIAVLTDENSVYDETVVVNFGNADQEGQWSWGADRNWDSAQQTDLEAFFIALGEINWRTLYQDQNHGDRPTSAYCAEAYQRWCILDFEQFDTVFRFRLTGACRLYGIRMGNCFYLIWLDLNHLIMPSILKHT